MLRYTKIFYLLLSFLFLINKHAQAVPSFARNNKVSCTSCHTVFPYLNAYGRQFKENLGQDLQQEVIDALTTTNHPFSARFKLRALDKRLKKTSTAATSKADKAAKIRSLHEGEVFLAGRTGKTFYFGEIESEDEWPDSSTAPGNSAPGFDVRLATAYVGYSILEAKLNILGGLASPFTYDAGGTINHHNLMRGNWEAANFVPGASQFIGLAGSSSNFIYMVSYHGDDAGVGSHVTEGKDPKSLSARVAYAIQGHRVGISYTDGERFDTVKNLSENAPYNILSADLYLYIEGLEVRAIYVNRKATRSNNEEKDNAFSLELLRPFNDLVPVIGLDHYTENNKTDKYTNLQLALLYGLSPSSRVSVNYERTLKAPSRFVDKNGRISILGEVAF